MTPTTRLHRRLPQEALDRCHELAVASENVQTKAEALSGAGNVGRLEPDDARRMARGMLGQCRLLCSSAEKLVSALEGFEPEPDPDAWTPTEDPG